MPDESGGKPTFKDTERLLDKIGAEGQQRLLHIIKPIDSKHYLHVLGMGEGSGTTISFSLKDPLKTLKSARRFIIDNSREARNRQREQQRLAFEALPEDMKLLHCAVASVFDYRSQLLHLMQKSPEGILSDLVELFSEQRKLWEQYDDSYANRNVLRMQITGPDRVGVFSHSYNSKEIKEFEVNGQRIPVEEFIEFMKSRPQAPEAKRSEHAEPLPDAIHKILEEGPQRRGREIGK